MVSSAGRVFSPAVVEAKVVAVAHVAVAPGRHAVRCTEVIGIFRRAGQGALVEEVPLGWREGDVGIESADAVGSGFEVVVAGKVREFWRKRRFDRA